MTTIDIGVDVPRAALVAIDCHRGHLDPSIATMPVAADAAERLVEANRRLMDWCRSVGIPVVHIVTRCRDEQEIAANPFWLTRARDPSTTRKNVLRHNLDGMPGCTIMPALDGDIDHVVATKKRYDCFRATDLDFHLRTHGINTVILTGVNTNSCVLATATAANVLDYAVIVARDCVDTMDGPELHDAALKVIAAAFGFVLSTDEIMALGLVPATEGTV